MKDQETVQKFIELRSEGWSFVRIASELGVAKSTLTEWSRKFCFEIQNRRALVLDDLPEIFNSGAFWCLLVPFCLRIPISYRFYTDFYP
jgi:hypothetical protein